MLQIQRCRFLSLVMLLCSLIVRAHDIPLFKAYPDLKAVIPHQSLGLVDATPVVLAQNLTDQQTAQLWIKHDGFVINVNGKKLFSGNKRRKLEFLLADAQQQHKKQIIATGPAGSNFACATAAYSQLLNLPCTLVLSPQRNTLYAQRNLKLDLLYGAQFIACSDNKERREVCSALAKIPENYVMTPGGSDPIGTLGYINAAFELKEQIQQGILPQPDVIYIAVCSKGMAAGLILGLTAAKLNIPVRVVHVVQKNEAIDKSLIDFMTKAQQFYKDRFGFEISLKDQVPLVVESDFSGDDYLVEDKKIKEHARFENAYALTSPKIQTAIKKCYEVSGIMLDGTYSGKAFAACFNNIVNKQHEHQKVLFWASFCGDDFSKEIENVDVKLLPSELQKYCNGEYPLQPLDLGVGKPCSSS